MTHALAAVFHGPGKNLELRSILTPTPQGGEILVRVLACTLCGSDLHTYLGHRSTPLPTVLGHEIVGEIAAFGDHAPKYDLSGSPLQLGDRITWSIVASCGECFYCRRGLPQKCVSMKKYGHEALRPGRELLGGLAEYCLLLAGTAIVRLPEALPLATACPANCATATVAAAVAAAGIVQDRHTCIFGMGMLGLSASAMLSSQNPSSVVCVDVDEGRLSRAKDFGATHAITPDALSDLSASLTEKHGFDLALEVSGHPDAFQAGLETLRMGGAFIQVGAVFPAPPVALPLERLVRRNLTLQGIHNYTPPDLLNAVRFLEDRHQEFPFADLVDAWFSLSQVKEAFTAGENAAHIRVGVHFES